MRVSSRCSQRVDGRALEQDIALRGLKQADDELEEHGLAAAALADDRKRFLRVDGEVDAGKHLVRAETHADAAKLDDR